MPVGFAPTASRAAAALPDEPVLPDAPLTAAAPTATRPVHSAARTRFSCSPEQDYSPSRLAPYDDGRDYSMEEQGMGPSANSARTAKLHQMCGGLSPATSPYQSYSRF